MTMDIDELRPILHQHVCMLTTAGHSPAKAIAIATHVAVLIHSEFLAEQIKLAEEALELRKI